MEIRDGVLYGPDPNKFFCGNPYDEESYGIYARGLQKALAKSRRGIIMNFWMRREHRQRHF